MAFTPNTYNIVKVPTEGQLWYKSLYIADLTGCEDIIAAVSGSYHYLTRLVIRTATAMTVTIGSGETTSAVTTAHIGPIPFDAASGLHVQTFPDGMGMKGTISLALTADASASGAIWIEAYGKTCLT